MTGRAVGWVRRDGRLGKGDRMARDAGGRGTERRTHVPQVGTSDRAPSAVLPDLLEPHGRRSDIGARSGTGMKETSAS